MEMIPAESHHRPSLYLYHHYHTDCVRQCMECFGQDLDFIPAMHCLDDVPLALQGHIAVEKLRLKAMGILSEGLADPVSLKTSLEKEGDELEKVLMNGASALCQYLGPINAMFKCGVMVPSTKFEHIFPKVALLHDCVKVRGW